MKEDGGVDAGARSKNAGRFFCVGEGRWIQGGVNPGWSHTQRGSQRDTDTLRGRHTRHVTQRHTHRVTCKHTLGGSYTTPALPHTPFCCGTQSSPHTRRQADSHTLVAPSTPTVTLVHSHRVLGTRSCTHDKVTTPPCFTQAGNALGYHHHGAPQHTQSHALGRALHVLRVTCVQDLPMHRSTHTATPYLHGVCHKHILSQPARPSTHTVMLRHTQNDTGTPRPPAPCWQAHPTQLHTQTHTRLIAHLTPRRIPHMPQVTHGQRSPNAQTHAQLRILLPLPRHTPPGSGTCKHSVTRGAVSHTESHEQVTH